MHTNKVSFEITGITETNLKNIDFLASTAEVIVISGVSGSGKSTLVNRVIAAEAKRQSRMRRKSDDLFDYCVRPNFQTATTLPEPVIISQRAIIPSASSTFGTRTGLNDLLVRLFLHKGEIFYRNQKIDKPDLSTILQFRDLYHPQAQILGCIGRFVNINHSKLEKLRSSGLKKFYLRAEGKHTFKTLTFDKLPISQLSRYEVFINLESEIDLGCLPKSQIIPVLIDGTLEIDFHEHGVSLKDGTVFRLPSKLLFSHSTLSSHSGYCRDCNGTGSITHYDVESAINPKIPLKDGFLTVPISASGRYKGFKFLPSGLANLLKKENIDVSQSYQSLSSTGKSTVLNILTDKIARNSSDPVAQQFLSTLPCKACDSSGLSWQARAVTLNEKSIDFFFGLTPSELLAELKAIDSGKDEITSKIRVILRYLSALSIDHISLNRPMTSMSSGETQRIKLLPVLVNKYSGRLIIIDEPSSNLQYRDNLKILKLIYELKLRNNSVIVVDHNPMYQMIADRSLKIGPGPGAHGGNYCSVNEDSPPLPKFHDLGLVGKPTAKLTYTTLQIPHLRNLRLDHVHIPLRVFSAIIGSSGTGKSTLCRELLYTSLVQRGDQVTLLDSTPPRGASNSVVATYLNVLDKLRRFYSNGNEATFTGSDFSFNSAGACDHCQGKGHIDGKVCSTCFGSRFKSEVALFSVEGYTLPELLTANLDQISMDGGLAFLSEALHILKLLSLSHLSLGRKTSSLSGGELQRLKVARFLLANQSASTDREHFVLLDEPCRGLDPQAVENLFNTLSTFLPNATIVVIEHNPYFIYRCQYLIDLGEARGIKDNRNVIQGHLGEKTFPSLNHAQAMGESQNINLTQANKSDTDLRIEDNEQPRELNTKRYKLIPSFLIQQKNFAIETKFSNSFTTALLDKNVFLYRSRNDLERALRNESCFFFNPFIALLERFPRVPTSLQREVLRKIHKNDIACDSDPWSFRVKAHSLQSAYLNGAGVVIVPGESGSFTYHTVRLMSLCEQVVDRVFPHTFAFNLYKNSCQHCNGYGHIQSYPLQKWIDRSRSVLQEGFMPYPIYKVVPKATIKHFAKEGLFDFSQAADTLTEREFNILLYGFKAYRFRKASAKDNSESSFYEWRGINSYLYRNSQKLSPDKNLNEYVEWVTCPFCVQGFSEKIKFYTLQGALLTDCMNP